MMKKVSLNTKHIKVPFWRNIQIVFKGGQYGYQIWRNKCQ